MAGRLPQPRTRGYARVMHPTTRRLPVLWRLALALGLGLLAGCPGADNAPTVTLNGQSFTVEIADEPAEQERGMMFRRELAADRGMLFVFPEAQMQAFWMRNCLIPLDILYFDADRRFVNGHFNAAPCNADNCPTYPSLRPARYVLELAGGVGRDLNLRPGDAISLPEALTP